MRALEDIPGLHVSNINFGRNIKGINASISEVLDKVKQKLDSVEAHTLLSDVYANAVGIFNLNTDREKRPLYSVAMHDAEENGLNSVLFDALRQYKDNGVLKHFGIPWHEFKKFTHEEFTMIMELSLLATDAENKRNIDGIDDLEKSLQKNRA
jgi:hypothetical protein